MFGSKAQKRAQDQAAKAEEFAQRALDASVRSWLDGREFSIGEDRHRFGKFAVVNAKIRDDSSVRITVSGDNLSEWAFMNLYVSIAGGGLERLNILGIASIENSSEGQVFLVTSNYEEALRFSKQL